MIQQTLIKEVVLYAAAKEILGRGHNEQTTAAVEEFLRGSEDFLPHYSAADYIPSAVALYTQCNGAIAA